MSLRIDTSEWISGSLLIGETGLGVLGSTIPATGDNGAGYAYNDLSLPADNGREICGRITTWPAAGTLFAYEDTSFTFTAPDGTYSFQYQLYVDGVAVGVPVTVLLAIGNVNGLGSGTPTNITITETTAIGYTDVNINGTATGTVSSIYLSTITAIGSADILTLTQADIYALVEAIWSHPKALSVGKFLGLK